MAKELSYRVLPAELPPAPAFEVEVYSWGLGCFLMLVALVGVISIETMFGDNPMTVIIFIVLLGGAPFLTFVLHNRKRRALLQTKATDWTRNQLNQLERHAEDLTRRARELAARFDTDARSLPVLLENADKSLGEAEVDLGDRAYAPFWDNIEEAAMSLGTFNANLRRMESGASSYTEILKGQIHNFPSLSISSVTIPNPVGTLERLRQVVRRAQRDYEFASIWEHRKTRQVLIEGFHTIGDAVSNLGSVTEGSFIRATKAIEESSAGIQREQVRLRESFEESVAKWEKRKQLYGK